MASRRVERINTLIQSFLASHIQKEFCNTRDIIICVTRVETSENVQEAKVFVSAFPTETRAGVVRDLNSSIRTFQDELNKGLKMRPVPRIWFVEDKKPEAAQEVETILEQIKQKGAH
jgi:ribosome-binding factor A